MTKTETTREIAERVTAEHLGPRRENPLMQQIGRAYERLIDDFEAALNAERERAAKIAETHSATDCAGPDCGIEIAKAIRGSKQ